MDDIIILIIFNFLIKIQLKLKWKEILDHLDLVDFLIVLKVVEGVISVLILMSPNKIIFHNNKTPDSNKKSAHTSKLKRAVSKEEIVRIYMMMRINKAWDYLNNRTLIHQCNKIQGSNNIVHQDHNNSNNNNKVFKEEIIK